MKLSEHRLRKVIREALSKILLRESKNLLREGADIPDEISKKIRARVKGKVELMDPRPKGRLVMDITIAGGKPTEWKQNKSGDEDLAKDLGSFAWRAANRAISDTSVDLEDGVYTWTLVV